jgi:hypothetical protein
LPDHLQRVEERRAGDDGGAVLVVVEDRDLHALPELLLDVEALRGLDVLEVDAAEGGLERGDDLDERSGSARATSRSKTSMSAKRLKRTPLPSITGLEASGPMSPRPEHGGAVADDGDEVAAVREVVGPPRVLGDDAARRRHPGEYASDRSSCVDMGFVARISSFPGFGGPLW